MKAKNKIKNIKNCGLKSEIYLDQWLKTRLLELFFLGITNSIHNFPYMDVRIKCNI